MAKGGITQTEVYKAAQKLIESGQNPTDASVHRLVGGSMTTVNRHMQKWRRIQKSKSEILHDASRIPSELAHAVTAVYQATRDAALKDFEDTIKGKDTRITELEAALARQRQELDTATAEIETLQAQHMEAEQEIAASKDRLAKTTQQLSSAHREIDALKDSTTAKDARLAALDTALNELKTKIDAADSREKLFAANEAKTGLQLQQYIDKNARLMDEREITAAQIDALSRDLNSEQEQHKKTLGKLNEALLELTEQSGLLSTTQAQLKESVRALNTASTETRQFKSQLDRERLQHNKALERTHKEATKERLALIAALEKSRRAPGRNTAT